MFPQFQYPAYGFPQFPRQQVWSQTYWLVCESRYFRVDAHSRFKSIWLIDHPQGFPYFVPSYGYPQQRNTVVLQPNKGQQNLERTTQRPQLPLQVRRARWNEVKEKIFTSLCILIKNNQRHSSVLNFSRVIFFKTLVWWKFPCMQRVFIAHFRAHWPNISLTTKIFIEKKVKWIKISEILCLAPVLFWRFELSFRTYADNDDKDNT